MSSKASSKGRGILLILAIIISIAGGYFLNWAYPFENLIGPSPWGDEDGDDNSTSHPPGALLQTVTLHSATHASILGTNLVETVIPGMEMNITTQTNSTVESIFVASYFIDLNAGFLYGAEWNVSLLVDKHAVMTSNVFAYRTSAVTETEYEGGNICMICMVSDLTPGIHEFEVVYFSLHDKDYCTLHIQPSGYNFQRYFTVNEWYSEE